MKKLSLILLSSVVFIHVYNYLPRIEEKGPNEGIVRYSKDNKIILNNMYIVLNKKVNKNDKIKINNIKCDVPSSNTNFNLFNFKNYLLSKKVFYYCKAEDVKVVEKHKLNIIEKQVKDIDNPYLDTLILGNNKIDEEAYNNYKINGITHLFAISGMHITFISLILLKILNSIFKNKKISFVITSILLTLYLFLTNMSASIIRSVLLFIAGTINKVFNLKIKTLTLLYLIFLLLLYINPYYIYDTGFIYSFTISFMLIYLKPNKAYKVSLIAFLASFPISINTNYSINLLTPILNILYVPFFSFIIFPLGLLTFFIPYLNPIFSYFVNLLELSSSFLAKYNIELIFKHMNLYIIIIYYLIFILSIKKKNYIPLILFFIIYYNSFNLYPTLTMLDVKRGDSFLLELPFNKGNILIDSGGSDYYDINKNVLTPYLKSRGIKKLDYIILTHGDLDHMGSSINLIDNYKPNRVIFNCGSYEELEETLIKKLDSLNIPYSSCMSELNINNYKLKFLNYKDYYNENDNSSIIYFNINNFKFLLMGDASIKVEEDLIKKYDLNNIDILKVGHHGSKTSSSKYFIDTIKPKYSLISVDKNNIYGHPHNEVINNLSNSKIYRTDKNGSVMFKIKNTKLEIETCAS